MAWRWLSIGATLALHSETLAEHGGSAGVRDAALVASALDRPRNRATYEPTSTLSQLAASLAFGLAKNHAFVDGNKRIALVASFAFVELNGGTVSATEAEAYATFIALAAGELEEGDLADWFAAHVRKRRRSR